MDAATLFLMLVVAGVNFGWQPAADSPDGVEYIVQVEPELLDVLRSGETMPIESHVPPELGPIRKVSVVVGRGELPRTAAGPVKRTAYFAGETNWAPGRYDAAAPATASTYDRYGAGATGGNTAVSPPPSVIDRAQTAVTDTGTSLRDGVEAGIQAANQQLSRGTGEVVDATRRAGQEFGREMQNWTTDPARQLQATGDNLRTATERTLGAVGNPFSSTTSQPPAAPRNQASVAPPPWPGTSSAGIPPTQPGLASRPATDRSAASSVAATRTDSGWTSIGSSVAAPPLLVPQPSITSSPMTAAPLRTAATDSSAPDFSDRAPRLSAPANVSSDWENNWDTRSATAPATIGRTASSPDTRNTTRDSGLVPVQPLNSGTQVAPQQANNWADPWAETDSWAQPRQSTPAITANPPANNSAPARSDANDWQLGGSPPPAVVTNNPSAPPIGGRPNGMGALNPTNPAAQPAASGPTARNSPPFGSSDQPPWLPLLIVSLSLVGSLSANLFLGWSYIDARQKYRSLVQKTADTFRRVTNAAA